MAQEVQITNEAGLIRATYRGDMQYDAATEMLRKVGTIASETQLKRLLFDLRSANYRDYHLGVLRHAEEAPALGIDRTLAIALLGAKGNPMLTYFEAVAVNRGYLAKAFTDEAEAVAWLRSVP